MTDRTETYDVADAPRLEIATIAGDIIITSWDENRVRVVLSGDAKTVNGASIDVTSNTVSIRSDSHKQGRRFFSQAMDVIVTMPPGGSVRIGSSSGDIRVRVPLKDIDVRSSFGDIRILEPVGEARIKVASGQVKLADVTREAEVTSANGDIRISHAADAVVSTASGSTFLGEIDHSARVKSASGDVRIRDFEGTSLEVRTMSGNTSIGLPPGRIVHADIKTKSGEIRNKIRPSEGERTGRMTLMVRSFSGDVVLRPAR